MLVHDPLKRATAPSATSSLGDSDVKRGKLWLPSPSAGDDSMTRPTVTTRTRTSNNASSQYFRNRFLRFAADLPPSYSGQVLSKCRLEHRRRIMGFGLSG